MPKTPLQSTVTHRLPLGIGLAPMEGVTSFAMRVWFYLVANPETMSTPFLRVTDTYPWKTLPVAFAPELTTLHGQTPYRLIPQMMATEVSDFLRAASYFPAHVPFLELNCGCPAPTCVGKGAGSSLLKEADLFGEMIGQLTTALGPDRVAVKMRTGYHSHQEFPRLLQAIRSVPLARLTIHGRSRPDRYRGQARWDLMQDAVHAVASPVVASGDITDLPSLNRLLDVAPGIKGALVGRGALRNPWIFEEIRDGQPQAISRETLVHALGSYVLLHELDVTTPERLHRCAAELFASPPCGRSESRWIRVFSLLAKILTEGGSHSLGRHGEWPAIELKRNTLGRAKMLWNYMRSGLPDFMFDPHVMRAKSLNDLLVAIHRIAGDAGDKGLAFAHRQEIDWLYAGGRDPQENDEAARTNHETETC